MPPRPHRPRRRQRHNPPLANVNVNGAFIMVGKNGRIVSQHATVDAAALAILDIVRPRTPQDYAHVKGWLPALAYNKIGAVDCYDSAYPIIWFDPALDDCTYEVEDYEEWEAATMARKR